MKRYVSKYKNKKKTDSGLPAGQAPWVPYLEDRSFSASAPS